MQKKFRNKSHASFPHFGYYGDYPTFGYYGLTDPYPYATFAYGAYPYGYPYAMVSNQTRG
ncbi:hypothetical protein ANCCEY_05176 [Ancylostoma ceylanicum]|uniref:Sulfur globule protein CV3 domain protein n=1 Tax=Ancylostoma ceylanicum TaxID=53326 RepID=A0A0D6LX15_9BILA|nr:hypothetical protein ANCCEY_05176 [Ancylostoma ceylanicum]